MGRLHYLDEPYLTNDVNYYVVMIVYCKILGRKKKTARLARSVWWRYYGLEDQQIWVRFPAGAEFSLYSF